MLTKIVIAALLATLASLLAFQFITVSSFSATNLQALDEKTTESKPCLLFTCSKINYPSSANITPTSYEIGFDIGREDLKFGQIPKGSSGKRFINIDNGKQAKVKIRLVSFGNVSSYVKFSDNDFVLGISENKSITVEFNTNPVMKEGLYSGGVSVIKISPKYNFLDFMLGWL